MKRIVFLTVAFLTASSMTAQDITGQWNGILNVQRQQLRVVFHISKNDTGYVSTMDSPDQGAFGIPTTSTEFENSTLKIIVSNLAAEYDGVLKADSIIGKFKQAGQSFPLNLSKGDTKKETVIRPQEPKKPYPYYSEDVTFKNNKADVTLAGTLTLPKKEGMYPAVILITGSGPQNRDEEIMGH